MKLTIKEIQEIETNIVSEVSNICETNNLDYFMHCGSVLGALRHKGPIPWDTDVDIIVPHNQYKEFIEIMRRELSSRFYVDYYDTNKYYPGSFARIGLAGYSTEKLHVDVFRLTGTSDNKQDQIKLNTEAVCLLKKLYYKTYSQEYRGKMSLKRRIRIYLNKVRYLGTSSNKINLEFNKLCDRYSFDEAVYVTNLSGHYGMKNVLPKAFYGKGIYIDYAGIQVKIPERYEEYLRHYYGDYMVLPPKSEQKVDDFYDITEQIYEKI